MADTRAHTHRDSQHGQHIQFWALFCRWHIKCPHPLLHANYLTHTHTFSLSLCHTQPKWGRERVRWRETIISPAITSIKNKWRETALPPGHCLLPTVSHFQSSCVCTYLIALMCAFLPACLYVCACIMRQLQLYKSRQDVSPYSKVRKDERKGKQGLRRDDRKEEKGDMSLICNSVPLISGDMTTRYHSVQKVVCDCSQY